MTNFAHLAQFPNYVVEDIDWAWKDLLEKVKVLSDGTPVPVHLEAQNPEAYKEDIPCIGVRLVTMVPDYNSYEGWNEMPVGYTRDSQGFPMHEAYQRQPEHYIIQYEVFALSGNPLHDRELTLKIGMILTPRPVLRLTHAEGNPVLQGFQQPYKLIADRDVFVDRTDEEGEQRLYNKVWLYNVPVDLPHPEVGLEAVAQVTEWRGIAPPVNGTVVSGTGDDTGDDSSHDDNNHTGVSLSIGRGPADLSDASELDLPMDSVDIPEELRDTAVKVTVTDYDEDTD